MRKHVLITALAVLLPALMTQSAAAVLNSTALDSSRLSQPSLPVLTARWWQWDLAIPLPINPSFDTTGENCDVQQPDRVFFLAGSATFEPVTRACTVPAGRPILLPLINVECSDVEAPPFFGATFRERRACAMAIMNGVGRRTLKLELWRGRDEGPCDDDADDDSDADEGRSLASYIKRVQSPPFGFSMPADENILFLPGVTGGQAASDGYWALLPGLAEGQYCLHFEASFVSGQFNGLKQDVTYELEVA